MRVSPNGAGQKKKISASRHTKVHTILHLHKVKHRLRKFMWVFQYRDSTVRTIWMVLNTKNIVLEGKNLRQLILLSTLIIGLQLLCLYSEST